ncbi:MAG: restriction endonuclease [Coriobacteriia bacterium]|nr:restriction endonuclease [Coriobacteriia bacterium]
MCPSDVLENDIRSNMPRILEILLIDRTTSTPSTSKNIIWANDHYKEYGADEYAATAEIKPELITGEKGTLIMPRALKTRALQKTRTKMQAEVFTPTWIVKKQNDIVDEGYQTDDLEAYTCRTWLEVACGEAPYMATRYDMGTGEPIPLVERTGFVDRKFARINNEVDDKAEWQRLVELAYKSSYGFEWNGDSLLLARENLLYTYRDYYVFKWGVEPLQGLFEEIAKIISYNIFQMDGLKLIIPLTEKKEKVNNEQLLLFESQGMGGSQQELFDREELEEEWRVIPGKRVRVMNWDTNKMEYFDKGVKR